MKLPADTRIEQLVLTQRADDSAPDSDTDQRLEIKIFDSGGGAFAVITTERWAMDGENGLAELNDFCSELCAAYNKTETVRHKEIYGTDEDDNDD